jgi:hypothetical protein
MRAVRLLARCWRALRAIRLLLRLIVAWVREGGVRLLGLLLLLLLGAKLVVWGWLLVRAELGVWCRWLLLLLGGVGGGGLLGVGCRGLLRVCLGLRLLLLLRRVHLRLVLLLVGVLGLGRLGSRLRAQHWRALRLHLDRCVVGGGRLVLLVPEAEGVAAHDESCNEEEPR